MHIIFRNLASKLPFGFSEKFELSNHPLILKVRAKIGLSRSEQAISLAMDSTHSYIGHCPICARTISCHEVVSLFSRKRTSDNRRVRIPDERTLWVEIDGVEYQIGCLPPICVDKDLYSKIEEGDRFGMFDNSGVLTRVTAPLVKKPDSGFGGHKWNQVSVLCTQRSG